MTWELFFSIICYSFLVCLIMLGIVAFAAVIYLYHHIEERKQNRPSHDLRPR